MKISKTILCIASGMTLAFLVGGGAAILLMKFGEAMGTCCAPDGDMVHELEITLPGTPGTEDDGCEC